MDRHCGFCFRQNGTSYVDNTGSCLPVDISDITHSIVGMCSEANKTSGIVWGYEFCPSRFGCLVLIGMLVCLLMQGGGNVEFWGHMEISLFVFDCLFAEFRTETEILVHHRHHRSQTRFKGVADFFIVDLLLDL